jgi:hypothetical protein
VNELLNTFLMGYIRSEDVVTLVAGFDKCHRHGLSQFLVRWISKEDEDGSSIPSSQDAKQQQQESWILVTVQPARKPDTKPASQDMDAADGTTLVCCLNRLEPSADGILENLVGSIRSNVKSLIGIDPMRLATPFMIFESLSAATNAYGHPDVIKRAARV